MNSATGKIIKTRLEAMEKTQGWLAEIAGVSINAVSKWTKTGKIGRSQVPVVAKALGITADQLLRGDLAGAEPSTGPAGISAVEHRLLTLYREADDRGKLAMQASWEEYARSARAASSLPQAPDADSDRRQRTAESKTHQLGAPSLVQHKRRGEQ